MAESFNSGDKRHLNDDTIKHSLKTGLERLEASDELIKKTLDRCYEELNRPKEQKSFFNLMFSRISLRYCATVVAAGLILAFVIKFPSLFGTKSDTGSQASATRVQAAADTAGAATGRPGSAAPSMSKSLEGYMFQETMPSASATPAPEVVAPRTSGSVNFTLAIPAAPKTLNSLALKNDRGADHKNTAASPEAFNAVVSAYNQNNGTKFTYDEKLVRSVSVVSSSGITSDTLRKTSDYRELMGTGSYWLLPIKDGNGNIISLLPVFESANNDGSGTEYDISVTYSEELWTSSQGLRIVADQKTTDLILDDSAIEKLVQDISGANRITELLIADINNGRDFMAFATAGGQEYAVPLFTSISVPSLVNGRAYSLREAFDALAAYLDSGG